MYEIGDSGFLRGKANWRASETLLSVENKQVRYVHIYKYIYI